MSLAEWKSRGIVCQACGAFGPPYRANVGWLYFKSDGFVRCPGCSLSELLRVTSEKADKLKESA